MEGHQRNKKYSAAGNGLTNIMKNHTFVPRPRYLRLLRRRRRYELLYHSVLRLCSEFRESRPLLWLSIKKSIHGKSSRIKKMRRDQARTPLPRIYTRISRLWSSRSSLRGPSFDATEVHTYFPGMFTAVCERFVADKRACPRRIAIFTSLRNNHMLAEISLHRTGTGAVHKQMSFSKDLCSLYSRDFYYTR